MANFGRYYAWFLLVATLLPAIIRLAAPRQYAELTSERIADLKKRGRHRMLGWISIAGSAVLIPVYFFYSQQRWMIVAFIIGILTGFEMIVNARSPERDDIRRQSVLFGWAYIVCCVFTYFFVLYKR